MSSQSLQSPPRGRIGREFLVLRLTLGLFLVGAAGLKVHALFAGSPLQESPLSSPRWQLTAIVTELLLGTWLLSGQWLRAAWIASLAFFSVLASASLYLALLGQTDCGCFGRLAVNPWVTFLLDLAILAALLLFRPRGISPSFQMSYGLRAAKVGMAAALLTLFVAVLFLAMVDRPADALARLRGEPLTVEPAVSEVGEAAAGTQRWFTVHLVNHTDHPIRVVGGTASCACTATQDLPVTVPPYEMRPINILMTFSGGAGYFQHRFALFTDHPSQPVVVARYAGRVVRTPSP